MTTSMKTQLSNSILIGDIFGMILFGLCIDRFGRRIGIILTTLFLVLVSPAASMSETVLTFQGIVIATAAHGTTVQGMFWMMIIGRGVAGVGAGGEYTVCTSQALECADSTPEMQRRRGLLVAVSTNAAIISGFVGSSIVSLIVLTAYGGEASDGVWRICFGIGIFVSIPSPPKCILTCAAPSHDLLLPYAAGRFRPVPEARYSTQHPVQARSEVLLEAVAGLLYRLVLVRRCDIPF
jgi:MFS family permease